MNPAKNIVQNQPLSASNKPDSSRNISASTVGKETESISLDSTDKFTEINSEVEISPELTHIGVKQTVEETIKIPADIAKLGVTSIGATQAVASTTKIPAVSLPISDDKVISGLSAQVTTALRWLSVWCIKKLQKAHLTLRVIHGKIVRVKN